MNNPFSSTQAVYNKYAAQFVHHFEKKLDTTELNEFLSQLPAGAKILDAGCGTARDAAYFVSRGFQALGIDLSAGLLAQAAQLHPEVLTQEMSLTDITLPDAEFDGVWCKAAILHLDRADIPKVLHSFYRILKPGGTVFIQTKAGEGEGTQPVPFDTSLTRYFTFFTQPELEKLVTEAGFTLTKSLAFNGKARSDLSRDQDWVVVFAKKPL